MKKGILGCGGKTEKPNIKKITLQKYIRKRAHIAKKKKEEHVFHDWQKHYGRLQMNCILIIHICCGALFSSSALVTSSESESGQKPIWTTCTDVPSGTLHS